METLVGYSGFVGSNLAMSHKFGGLYNSENIKEAYNKQPDLLIYAGVRAEKFLANNNPEKDLDVVKEAYNNIVKINPKRLVLISTVDVYKDPTNVDETSTIDIEGLHPYGLHRFYLEQWVRKWNTDALIIRLPALYGYNIKKNFIFDLINVIPSMLNQEKYSQLSQQRKELIDYYERQDNGFYKCKTLGKEERQKLKNIFIELGFSSVYFTDSESTYQYYNLSYLWEHIQLALRHSITDLNITTEPIVSSNLYRHITKQNFANKLSPTPPTYDIKSVYDELFGGGRGYFFDKNFIIEDVKQMLKKINP